MSGAKPSLIHTSHGVTFNLEAEYLRRDELREAQFIFKSW